MTRFHKFFATSLLVLATSSSTLAGEMDFPLAPKAPAATTASAAEVNMDATDFDATTEILIFVLESLLPGF